jgi:light-harvesting complex 1 alpha chain
MWRIWLLIDPRRVFVIQGIGLAFIAFMIHFILLGSSKYNWIDPQKPAKAPATQNAPMPAPATAPAGK